MTVEYGNDLSCIADMDATGREVSGLDVFLQALARRVTTRRGSLIDDPNYGLDVRDYLQDEISAERLAVIRTEVATEILKDERVLTATCSAVFSDSAKAITITVSGTGALGPFLLVLSVDSVTVQILKGT